ncbi:hypothetical protein V6Z11_A10G029000 [Gossypium hirsutum]
MATRTSSPSPSSSPPSSCFMLICLLHSAIAISSGAFMMFRMKEIYTFTHGIETASKLLGSTPHDQLLIRTSDSFCRPALVHHRSFFAAGCTFLHVFMAVWRFWFETRVEDLAWDCIRQTVGDILLALSWVSFLVYSWREKYD